MHSAGPRRPWGRLVEPAGRELYRASSGGGWGGWLLASAAGLTGRVLPHGVAPPFWDSGRQASFLRGHPGSGGRGPSEKADAQAAVRFRDDNNLVDRPRAPRARLHGNWSTVCTRAVRDAYACSVRAANLAQTL